ncbi:Cas10/Cmr2 second palm domain-containing protein [uncultured Chloroflexus sp.]|uniref:Cas10/Cmr2 second palm domain-containing protein n=1 Tax=uncultured Chloroflexus sp. TaxID=214040 RepID=UPI002604A952|nr:hypothetical protein [uncultured Chloroflexus sp.]
MSKKVLLSGDVDAIKDFVFETASLPQVRGGSELLLECEKAIQEDLQKKHGYQVIYCGGGSFLLEVDANKAEGVKRAIERLYLETTGGATVTIVYEDTSFAEKETAAPLEDGWAARLVKASQEATRASDFARRTAFLTARMQEAKAHKTSAPFYETFPFGKRCDRCGKRMAAYFDRVEENKVLCPVCHLRDRQGRERKGTIHEREVRGRFNQEFWQAYGSGWTAHQPEDLDTLLRTAGRKYLAFLYADGNDIGRLLQRVSSEKDYQGLSQALEEGTKQAVYEAIQAVCGEALKEKAPWPFEIVNIGGDDVTLLMQAGYAWEVAVEFLERFEQEVNRRVRRALGDSWPEEWPERITAACGIAIADVKYPMRYFERLAGDLCKEAKRLAKEDPSHPKSAATFLWLPSPIASESVEPLMSFYSRHPTGDLPCELTARPYTLEQAKGMMEASREIATWPRTLRHRWAEALEQGVMTSVNTIHYDMARRTGEKGLEMYQTLMRIGKLVVSGGNHTNIPAPIWYPVQKQGETVWRTALLDALELAELEAMRPEVEEEAE